MFLLCSCSTPARTATPVTSTLVPGGTSSPSASTRWPPYSTPCGWRLAVSVDERLAALQLHVEAGSAAWPERAGFRLTDTKTKTPTRHAQPSWPPSIRSALPQTQPRGRNKGTPTHSHASTYPCPTPPSPPPCRGLAARKAHQHHRQSIPLPPPAPPLVCTYHRVAFIAPHAAAPAPAPPCASVTPWSCPTPPCTSVAPRSCPAHTPPCTSVRRP